MIYSTRKHRDGVSITVNGAPVTEEYAAKKLNELTNENEELKKAAKELADRAGSIGFNAGAGYAISEGQWIAQDNAVNKVRRLLK